MSCCLMTRQMRKARMTDQMKAAEHCITRERRMWSALITYDDGTPALWEDLVRRTATVVSPEVVFWPYWSANSVFNPASVPEFYGLPTGLAEEWQVYARRWEAFLDLNPRCRIAEMMTEISEANDASSWPYGWEDKIRDWVRSGFPEPALVPWDERIKTPGWRAKIADAATRAGDGWVYYESDVYEWR